jgi:hypothetical protein
MADPVDDTRARNRWAAINVARLGGVALTVLGIMVLSGEVELPRVAGWIALVVGLAGALVLPGVLVRRWRTPGP